MKTILKLALCLSLLLTVTGCFDSDDDAKKVVVKSLDTGNWIPQTSKSTGNVKMTLTLFGETTVNEMPIDEDDVFTDTIEVLQVTADSVIYYSWDQLEEVTIREAFENDFEKSIKALMEEEAQAQAEDMGAVVTSTSVTVSNLSVSVSGEMMTITYTVVAKVEAENELTGATVVMDIAQTATDTFKKYSGDVPPANWPDLQ